MLGALPVLVTGPWELTASLPLALIVGLLDDAFSLPAIARAVAWLGCGALLGSIHGGIWSVALGAGLTLTTCIGVNFLDGIDGIAATVTLGGCACLIVTDSSSRYVASCLAASVAGFLLWNWAPARCYLGNSGSSIVGVWLAASMLESEPSSNGRHWQVVFFAAVMISEAATTVIRRLRGRMPVLSRERGHGYDQLVAAGHQTRVVAAYYGAVQVIISAVAVGSMQGWFPLSGALAIAGTLLGASAIRGGSLRPATPAGPGSAADG